jgi:hypothetical protein
MNSFPSIQDLQLTVRSHEILLGNLPKECAEERARGVAGTIGIFGGGPVVSFCSGPGVARRGEDIFHETLP